MVVGAEIPDGWTPAAWAQYLRSKAAACRYDHPDMAAEYDARAAHIEAAARDNDGDAQRTFERIRRRRER